MPIAVRSLDGSGRVVQLTPIAAAPAPAKSGCCGGEAPAGADACCALDAEVKSAGGSGCGCGTASAASSTGAEKGCC